LQVGAVATASTAAGGTLWRFAACRGGVGEASGHAPPAYSIIPVVGDGKWVWTAPPKDEKGYLEPRQYELQIGIELSGGRGSATEVKASTAAPVDLPEQQVDDVLIETDGCAAELRRLTPEAGQLALAAPVIGEKQTIKAFARYKLTLRKQFLGFEKDQFPAAQKFGKDFKRTYMYDSPGIQTRPKEVRDLAAAVGGQASHPWDKAQKFYEWVWENIKPRIGSYTSVLAALHDRVGDCEERAAVFVAFCRAAEIPARLVWVPNHNWAEFYLCDAEGEGHWIPVHTAAYSWFGWTGAHELVLQKGDSIYVPEKSKPYRLIEDWLQWSGARPKARFFADLKPLPPEGSDDAGPGARSKNELLGRDGPRGWTAIGPHAEEKFVRK
jgi:transglutaminase-like putative cysteine protease